MRNSFSYHMSRGSPRDHFGGELMRFQNTAKARADLRVDSLTEPIGDDYIVADRWPLLSRIAITVVASAICWATIFVLTF